jgi:doublesex- and mab-3-related transcription factor 4/5
LLLVIVSHSAASTAFKSAFSPLIPPAFTANRYPFLQHQAKRFLSAPYSGTGFLSSVLEPDQNDVNGNSNANAATADTQE